MPIDIDENGRLDFLTQHIKEDKTPTNGFSLIYNNIQKDQDDQNFFLKLMVLYDHTKSAPGSNNGEKSQNDNMNIAMN